MEERIMKFFVMTSTRSLRAYCEELKCDMTLWKRAMAYRVVITCDAPKLDIHKPKTYRGSKNAWELENFMWDLKKYFTTMKIEDKATKVHNDSLYLTDTAMLW